jgi:hypothetical protein
MALPSTAEPHPPGPATRADADVRAALSALRGLSTPAEGGAEPPVSPRGDRYTRVHLHARGGLGQVWLGRDELVGRDVAIKEPRTDRPGGAARSALEREVWVLGRLQHPNIVPLYDLVRGPDGLVAFYVMPFLGGDGLHDLADRFHRSRPPGPATRLTLLPLLTAFLDVCAALDHAHDRGVWHVDIKGANVKIGPAGAAVVLDWGLARLAAPASGEPPARAGSAGGTPAFVAPGQADSPADRLGPHTDVYGLGALLYLLLTGRPPHPDAAGCDRDELAAALRRPVTPPHAAWPGVPAALEAVCLKALGADPADRYGCVAGLREEVRHWLADEPVPAYPERLAERLARWGRRYRRAATGAAAVLVTTVLALAVGLLAVDRERQEKDRQRQAAETALARERDSFRQALKAGNDYFTAVSDSPLLRERGGRVWPRAGELFPPGIPTPISPQPPFAQQLVRPNRILDGKRRVGFVAVIDGKIVSPVIVSRGQDGPQVEGHVRIFSPQRDAERGKWLAHAHRPVVSAPVFPRPRYQDAVIARDQRRSGHRRGAGTEQVDFDPVNPRGHCFPPLLHETGAAPRATDLVRRAEDLNEGYQGLRLAVADLEAGFLDLVIDQQWHDQWLCHGDRGGSLPLLLFCSLPLWRLFDADFGDDGFPARIVFIGDVDPQFNPGNVVRSKERIEGALEMADESVMHVGPQVRHFQIRVHPRERRRHGVSSPC